MASESVETSTRRILFVEDDLVLVDALGRLLTNFGCTVVGAETISEAKHRLQESVFDLAILDIDLPDGCGLDIVLYLRGLADPCAAVILTGSDRARHLREAVGLGVTEYLLKPVAIESLVSAIDRGVEQTRHMRGWMADHPAADSLRELGGMLGGRATGTVRQVTAEFGLTIREFDALQLVADGYRDLEISKRLGISYSRVRQLLARAFGKMGLHGRNDFIRFLCERVLI